MTTTMHAPAWALVLGLAATTATTTAGADGLAWQTATQKTETPASLVLVQMPKTLDFAPGPSYTQELPARLAMRLTLDLGKRRHYSSYAGGRVPELYVDLGVVLPGEGTLRKAEHGGDWATRKTVWQVERAAAAATAGGGEQLEMRFSRMTPGVLIRYTGSRLVLFGGQVLHPRNQGRTIDAGGAFHRNYFGEAGGNNSPRHLAWPEGRPVTLESGGAPARFGGDVPWALVWYGVGSHFYAYHHEWRPRHKTTATEASDVNDAHMGPYLADAPMMLLFQHPPISVQARKATNRDNPKTVEPAVAAEEVTGGLEFTFAKQAGHVAVVPLCGSRFPEATTTEPWTNGLPAEVVRQCQWWADHLAAFPLEARETYGLRGDDVLISGTVTHLLLREGAKPFAPIPPMLAMAKEFGMPIEIGGSIEASQTPTLLGPYLMTPGTSYTVIVKGVRKYFAERRVVAGAGMVPVPLRNELLKRIDEQVARDFAPMRDYSGVNFAQIYRPLFLRPGEVCSYLRAALPVLEAPHRAALIAYLRSQYDRVPMTKAGALPYPDPPWAFKPGPPRIDTLYHYWGYLADVAAEPDWREALGWAHTIAKPYLAECDWASGPLMEMDSQIGRSPLEGGHSAADSNRFLAGMVGLARIARQAGDDAAVALATGLFAREAAVRYAGEKYPEYLVAYGVLKHPADPHFLWEGAGIVAPQLWATEYRGPEDNVRGVVALGLDGPMLCDFLQTVGEGDVPPGLLFLTPEVGRFLHDHLRADTVRLLERLRLRQGTIVANYAESISGLEKGKASAWLPYIYFLGNAWVADAPPEELEFYADVPLARYGDLLYIHKLAETIKAYRGVGWAAP